MNNLRIFKIFAVNRFRYLDFGNFNNEEFVYTWNKVNRVINNKNLKSGTSCFFNENFIVLF